MCYLVRYHDRCLFVRISQFFVIHFWTVINRIGVYINMKSTEKVFCKFCGKGYSNIEQLEHDRSKCKYATDGNQLSDKHKPYTGPIMDNYECKWCHEKFSSIKELVTGPCTRNNPTRMMLRQIKED